MTNPFGSNSGRIERISPHGIVERIVVPCSISGKVTSSMYLEAPVTLARPSFRGTFRPTEPLALRMFRSSLLLEAGSAFEWRKCYRSGTPRRSWLLISAGETVRMESRHAPRGLPAYENLEEREVLLRRTWERLDPAFRTPSQVLGRRSTIGCVALEITQRCNLDCTLCYLSENSESVKDLPLEVLFRRIDRIRETYGPGVGVQVTGGDPTLRKRDELVEIVRRIGQGD